MVQLAVSLLPVALSILTFVFSYLAINSNKFKPAWEQGFFITFIILTLFMATTTTIVGVEVAELEQNLTIGAGDGEQQSLTDISTILGSPVSITSMSIWVVTLVFAGLGVYYVVTHVQQWLKLR